MTVASRAMAERAAQMAIRAVQLDRQTHGTLKCSACDRTIVTMTVANACELVVIHKRLVFRPNPVCSLKCRDRFFAAQATEAAALAAEQVARSEAAADQRRRRRQRETEEELSEQAELRELLKESELLAVAGTPAEVFALDDWRIAQRESEAANGTEAT